MERCHPPTMVDESWWTVVRAAELQRLNLWGVWLRDQGTLPPPSHTQCRGSTTSSASDEYQASTALAPACSWSRCSMPREASHLPSSEPLEQGVSAREASFLRFCSEGETVYRIREHLSSQLLKELTLSETM